MYIVKYPYYTKKYLMNDMTLNERLELSKTRGSLKILEDRMIKESESSLVRLKGIHNNLKREDLIIRRRDKDDIDLNNKKFRFCDGKHAIPNVEPPRR